MNLLLDCETTGSAASYPVQVALLDITAVQQYPQMLAELAKQRRTAGNLHEVLAGLGMGWNYYMRPPESDPVLPGALAVHGIDEPFLACHEAYTVVGPRIRPVGAEDTVLGYSVAGDVRQVQLVSPGFRPGCTADAMRLVRKLFPQNVIGSYGLDAAIVASGTCELQELKYWRTYHDAMVDNWLTGALLLRLQARLGPDAQDIPGLVRHINTPERVEQWPVGKFKGQRIEPMSQAGYIEWFLTKSDVGFRESFPDLVWTLQQYQKPKRAGDAPGNYMPPPPLPGVSGNSQPPRHNTDSDVSTPNPQNLRQPVMGRRSPIPPSVIDDNDDLPM